MSMGSHDFADHGIAENEDRNNGIADDLGFLARYMILIAGVPAVWMTWYHFDTLQWWQAIVITAVIIFFVSVGPRGIDNVDMSNDL